MPYSSFSEKNAFEEKLNYFYIKLCFITYHLQLIRDLYSCLPCESLALLLGSSAVLQHERNMVTISNVKM